MPAPAVSPPRSHLRGRHGRVALSRPLRDISRDAAASLAVLSVAAAIVHLAAAPEHLGESRAAGMFLFALALGQLIAGIALFLHPTRALVGGTAGASAAVIALWTASRMTGVIPTTGGVPEAIGYSDAIATLLELGFVAMAIKTLRGRVHRVDAMRMTAIVGAPTLAAAGVYLFGHSHGAARAADQAGHGSIHLIALGLPVALFAVLVAVRIRRDGVPRFSWHL